MFVLLLLSFVLKNEHVYNQICSFFLFEKNILKIYEKRRELEPDLKESNPKRFEPNLQ